MDFIEKSLTEIKDYAKNVGLKRAMIIYIVIALLVTLISIIVIKNFMGKWEIVLVSTCINTNAISIEILMSDFYSKSFQYSELIRQLNLIHFIEQMIIFSIIIMATIIVTNLYYNSKLKEPLRIIEEEMRLINQNDLSFDCSYISGDEMGKVCTSLNSMRLQLIDNQKNIWALKENQKVINSAFAHDIRTPLTVMRGYVAIMLKFSKTNQISKDRSDEILMLLEEQVNKMERFTETMKEINDFDEWELKSVLIQKNILIKQIEQIVESIQIIDSNISINIETIIDSDQMQCLYCDLDIIQQVIVNLINNAIRYTNKKIDIQIMNESNVLYIYIQDDGCGFTQSTLKNATKLYYTTDKKHFGMGLFISQILCKKHKGNIELVNGINGGGIVIASFCIDKILK